MSPRDRSARAGGLAVAVRDLLSQRGGLWFGWSGETAKTPVEGPHVVRSGRITYATIDLEEDDYQSYYVEFANGMLWPLFHYRPGLFEFRQTALLGYVHVNAIFAKHLVPLLQPDDVIWVHDYHFMPLGGELRRLGVRNRIGFFLHIPFPVPELLLVLPGHKRIVEDLLKYDLVGFQTERDVRSLQRYVLEEAGGRVNDDQTVEAFGQRARVGAFPIGIDTEQFAAVAAEAQDGPETIRLRDSLSGRSLVIGVDRLDYSKGLAYRFRAFEELLSRWPEFRSRVTYLQVAPVSRRDVAQYRALRRELDGLAGRINGKFAEFDWTPMRYLNRTIPRDVLAGFYRSSRVGLVTSTRDGMNLVAKEYVAAQDLADPGVLVLSRFAGAAAELKDAIIVNPFDVDEVALALKTALTMPLGERIEHWMAMMVVLRHNTLSHWRDSFLAVLERDAAGENVFQGYGRAAGGSAE
jgi:trehalose 6-phosphate synthase